MAQTIRSRTSIVWLDCYPHIEDSQSLQKHAFFAISRLSTTYKQNSITRKSPAAGWVMMRADRSLAYSHEQQKNNKSDNNPCKIIALRCSRLFIAMSTHTLYSDQNGKSIFPLTCWERYLRAQHLCRLFYTWFCLISDFFLCAWPHVKRPFSKHTARA